MSTQTTQIEPLRFVNIHGCPVSVKPPPKQKAKRVALAAANRGEPAQFHRGWVVTGFSEKRLADAARDHKYSGRSDEPFDPEQYMRSARPGRVRPKPYESLDAANVCADLARKAGWQKVSVAALIKGRP